MSSVTNNIDRMADTAEACQQVAADIRYLSPVKPPGSGSRSLPPQHSAFLEILVNEDLQAVFQPIVNVGEQSVFGYEALIRGPRETGLESPLTLFRIARELDLESEFEILCRRVSIRAYARMGLEGLLFLNISPCALLNPGFRKGRTLQYLEQYGIDPSRVVIEMTEHEQVNSYEALRLAIQHYRAMGFQVALDDLGSGYSGLRLWTELMPDFIKIDKHFIRDIHQDSIKTNFVNGLVSMAAATHCRVIAEGVEQAAERQTLRRLRIALMQGHHFARPSSCPDQVLDEHCFDVSGEVVPCHSGDSVLRISRTVETSTPETRVEQVLARFQQNPALETLPVVDEEQRPLGLVDRYRFLNRLMESQYGVALYSRHLISEFVDRGVMQVELDTELSEVSQRITALASMQQAFIVTDRGRYYGIATIVDLLEIITEQKLQHAKHANPLTLLPGIVPTNDAINRLLDSGQSFHVAYVDLDNFKPYNDAYGYGAGDVVIKHLAFLLTEIYQNGVAHVGHIGGDDFLVVVPDSDFHDCSETLIRRFDDSVSRFYEARHLREGGLSGSDRRGNPVFYPLLSVSVGIVPPDCTRCCRSHIDIADLASEAKKLAKEQPGSGISVNRRRL